MEVEGLSAFKIKPAKKEHKADRCVLLFEKDDYKFSCVVLATLPNYALRLTCCFRTLEYTIPIQNDIAARNMCVIRDLENIHDERLMVAVLALVKRYKNAYSCAFLFSTTHFLENLLKKS
jgi:hypothetical protein